MGSLSSNINGYSKRKNSKVQQQSESSKAHRKSAFICVAEGQMERRRSPEYVWMNGQLQKMSSKDPVEGRDGVGNKIKCKVVPNGQKKLQQMSKKMKVMTKSFKKLSKTLNNLVKTFD